MSFVSRSYEEIVRDLLTTVTGGTVRETLDAPGLADDLLVLGKLKERPVRRVSFLEGEIANATGTGKIPYRFTSDDFELVSSTGDPNNLDSIRFRERGRRPMPGTKLEVNYYPVKLPRLAVTDINIGSVARTLLETFARELAVGYLHLDHIYESAFLDTAAGSSLEKVVALAGVARYRPGQPMVRLRFTRQPGLSGRITIPANTGVTDQDGNRYLLERSLTLESSEPSRDVDAFGEHPGTPLAKAGTLTRLESLIAGIGNVNNPEDAFRLTVAESDGELRRRARVALQGSVRGTLAALESGLRAIDGVKDIRVVEAPNNVPGEIRIDVAYSGQPAEIRPELERRVRELRPAGIRVVSIDEASKRLVRVQAKLLLAGTGVAAAALPALIAGAEQRLDRYFSSLPPGKSDGSTMVRRARISATLLEDERIADATVRLLATDGTPNEEITLAAGEVLAITGYDFETPMAEDVSKAAGGTSTVHADIPMTPVAGTSLTEAIQTFTLAFQSYLVGRRPDVPLDVESLRTACRDEAHYALAPEGIVVTVERFDGTFRQLSLGVGAYLPVTGEKLASGQVNIFDPRGGI